MTINRSIDTVKSSSMKNQGCFCKRPRSRCTPVRVATGLGQITTRACTERDRLFRTGAEITTGSCKDRERLVMTDARIAAALPVAFRTV
ncbi:hypothetical protein Taro_050273 [Colocasia esculenta]|uniref:Uncharacterized protein n=1 Tax=Colocasia esculenta TaxID=4460 RepID=A0A843XCZ8_COLES|nr:hypothetical protein [Colocasia esculenta]